MNPCPADSAALWGESLPGCAAARMCKEKIFWQKTRAHKKGELLLS
jgi:hypothetical protein